MQYIVRATCESDNGAVPVATFDTDAEASVFLGTLDRGKYRRLYVQVVPTWTDGAPDGQDCRVCGAFATVDVTGRPVAEVYPAPVVCSRACQTDYLHSRVYED